MKSMYITNFVQSTGTMGPEPVNGHVEPNRGSLFSLDSKNLQVHLKDISISNGLAWDTNLNKFYFIDSATRRVDQYDYDAKNGTISEYSNYIVFIFLKINFEKDNKII